MDGNVDGADAKALPEVGGAIQTSSSSFRSFLVRYNLYFLFPV